MGDEGIASFMGQIEVDPSKVECIVIAMYMDAAYMGEFTWPEFLKGSKALGVDSIAGWKRLVSRFREEANTETKFA